MIAAHKEKKAVGEKTTETSENIMAYLDAILKARAYDLLYLEKNVEKTDLMASIMEHGNIEAIKSLLTQV